MDLAHPPPPAGGFIHPKWHSVIPPYHSDTHPTFHQPYIPIPLFRPNAAPIPITIRDPNALTPFSPPSSASGSTLQTPSPAVIPIPYVLDEVGWPKLAGGAEEVRANVSNMWKRTPPDTPKRSSEAGAITISRGERMDEQGKSNFDRFASAYTPLWLRCLPPPDQTLALEPPARFPPYDYTSRILPSALTHQDALPITRTCPSILLQPAQQEPVRPLDAEKALSHPEYYAQHFSQLLSLYLLGQIEDMEKALVHMVPLHLDQTSSTPGTYRLHIPGIREDSPRLAIGDKLLLRGLYVKKELPSRCAVEAEVVGLAKSSGWVFVRSPTLGDLDKSLPKQGKNGESSLSLYQIKFLTSAAPACAMQDGIRTFGLLLEIGWEIARRWLFPAVSDVKNTLTTNGYSYIESWVDPALNEEQRAAVEDIVWKPSTVPYLISGPPGTGKTKLLVETILQLVKHHPDSAVLVCAPSNPAADTVARRLSRHLAPNRMFRLNAPMRTFAEVPDELLPYCHVVNNQFDLPAFGALMRYRVVVTTCLDAGILVAASATNVAMMRAESEHHTTFHPHSTISRSVLPHWTHLLIDEAAQASEPETTIPLSVVVPFPLPEGHHTKDPIVVLCGDIHQLGPIIPPAQARAGDLDVSLLERLFQREVYAAHPAARRHRRTNKGDVPWPYPPPFANLVRNYRSAPPILMIPATMFYEDTLIPAARDVSPMRWSLLPNPNIPILFQGCNAEEDWIEEGASWHNAGEVAIVVELIKALLAERPDIKQNQIAVITPWREQVWRARAALRRAEMRQVDVGNVETYQGGEFRVTIISCVRSRDRFLAGDHEANMGLYHQRKRFNVAITRAKELLVVVGNAELLKGDPYWNGFLQIMVRNNLYRGPKLELDMTGSYISRLESAMRANEKMEADEAVLLLAGAMAREALIED